jgi:putative addiction module component (TIGR02574 family)
MNAIMDEILKLNINARMRLANQIWKSIPKDKVSPPISEEVIFLLTDRLTRFKGNPNLGISLEESKKRVKSKIEIHNKDRARRAN